MGLEQLFDRNRVRRLPARLPHFSAARLSRFERLESRAMLAAFTPGNLVIYRVGTGTATLSSAATDVFLDEYAPNGTLVQSVAMPTADSDSNRPLTASGTATSEGMITRSTDGKFIVATGYAAVPGTTGVTSSAAATTNRVIGRIAADGTIDTSTTLTSFSGGNIRSAASTDGSSFWATGSNTGVVYQAFAGSGNGTIVSSSATVNLRGVGIFDDQLYASASSGTNTRVFAVGTGLPTTSGQAFGPLTGLPTTGSPYQFFFADIDGSAGVDTLYVADDSANVIQKYALVSGSWTANGTVAASGVRGLDEVSALLVAGASRVGATSADVLLADA